MVKRGYNFSAGPAMLADSVLATAQQEMMNWQNTGMSVFEISHRSPEFEALMAQIEQDLREIMAIPDDYHVLLLAAPGRSQFAMVPMNLLRGKDRADYLVTGIWSLLAKEEAERYCNVHCVLNTDSQQNQTIPEPTSWHLSQDAAYVHYCDNETITGLMFPDIPHVGEIPLAVDMTSSFLARPVDVSRFGLIYAGAQKNVAPAGLTFVIVRKDLVGNSLPATPTIYDYAIQAKYHSLYYTPPSFSCYVASLTLRWIKAQGGLEAIYAKNQAKAKALYAAIDASALYVNTVDKKYRSIMNVPFALRDPAKTAAFLDGAKARQLLSLKGHRLVGGVRASLYNAMPMAGVEALIAYMRDFEA